MDAWARIVFSLTTVAAESPTFIPTRAEGSGRFSPPPVTPAWKIVKLHELMPPGRPPCFDTQPDWVGYCEAAAGDTRHLHRDGPLYLTRGAVYLNATFDYCRDCTYARKHAMQQRRRCLPTWLKTEAGRQDEGNG